MNENNFDGWRLESKEFALIALKYNPKMGFEGVPSVKEKKLKRRTGRNLKEKV
jgi:hypothetical protein